MFALLEASGIRLQAKGHGSGPVEEGAGWQPGLALSGPHSSVSSLHGQPNINLITPRTVTRIDVIFRYPDRVPLTHFVHRAKKFFSM
jgi:hypothetical protein